MRKFGNMLAPIWITVLLLCSSLANAIPSPSIQSPPSVIEERQTRGSCADYGAASNKPEPDPLVQKREDGYVGSGQPYVAYQWTVTEGFITVHGACKFMHLINGNWPPPPIVVNHGTVIKLEVINRMPNDPITLHAHGLDQKNTQWMDGPESLTQRGIGPGKKFTYVYDTSKESPGTYWIHNHVSGQYPKGLRSPLIIKAKASASEEANWKKSDPSKGNVWDPYLDQVLSLSDWFSQDWGKWEDLYLNGKCGTGVEVPPIDFLVNDLRADKDNTQTYDFRTSKQNPKSGRIRLINMSAFTTFYVYIAPTNPNFISDIKLQVIEADGVLMDGSQTVQVVEVGPGQRLSVLVDPTGWAAAQSKPNVYRMVITVNPYEWRHTQVKSKNKEVDAKCYEGNDDVNTLKTKLPLHFINIQLGERIADDNNPGPGFGPAPTFYEKYKVLEDTNAKTFRACFLGLGWDCARDSDYPISKNFADFDDFNLKPLNSAVVSLPTSQSARFLIQTWENQGGDRRANLRVIRYDTQDQLSNANGYQAFAPQSTPAIELVRQGKKTYTEFADWKHTMIVPDNQNSYIVALYSWTGTHPIHLHGHKFRVLYRERQQAASQTGSVALTARLKKIFTFDTSSTNTLQSYDGTNINVSPTRNPLMRDTVTLYKYGLVVLHIEADNPGAWFLHCHNDFHAHTGMASMVIEKPDALQSWLQNLPQSDVDTYRKLINGGGFDNA